MMHTNNAQYRDMNCIAQATQQQVQKQKHISKQYSAQQSMCKDINCIVQATAATNDVQGHK